MTDDFLWCCKVCGESLENVTHENAIRTLRQTPPLIRLVVLRDEPSPDDDIYETITADLVKRPGQGLGFSIVSHQNGIFISDVVCILCFILPFRNVRLLLLLSSSSSSSSSLTQNLRMFSSLFSVLPSPYREALWTDFRV